MVGYHINRIATGIHDDIWARAVIFDDGHIRIALVVLDAIGIFNDDVIDIRKEIEKSDNDINHVIVASTHNH